MDMSERFDTPVVIRTTMRTSHSKSVVELGAPWRLRARGRALPPQHREVQLHVHVGAQAALHP